MSNFWGAVHSGVARILVRACRSAFYYVGSGRAEDAHDAETDGRRDEDGQQEVEAVAHLRHKEDGHERGAADAGHHAGHGHEGEA